MPWGVDGWVAGPVDEDWMTAGGRIERVGTGGVGKGTSLVRVGSRALGTAASPARVVSVGVGTGASSERLGGGAGGSSERLAGRGVSVGEAASLRRSSASADSLSGSTWACVPSGACTASSDAHAASARHTGRSGSGSAATATGMASSSPHMRTARSVRTLIQRSVVPEYHGCRLARYALEASPIQGAYE